VRGNAGSRRSNPLYAPTRVLMVNNQW